METTVCDSCGNVGLHKGSDGFVYCKTCGTQSQNFVEEEIDPRPVGNDAGQRTFVMTREHNVHRKKQELQLKKISDQLKGVEVDDEEKALLKILSQNPDDEREMEEMRKTLASTYSNIKNVRVWSGDQVMYDPSELPDRIGSHIRDYYVQGMQKMLQLMCESLVETCGVHPSVCGFAGSIWLNFVASTRLFEKSWVSEVILISEDRIGKRREAQPEKPTEAEPEPEPEREPGKRRRRAKKVTVKEKKVDEAPVTKHNRRVSVLCIKSLQERLPLQALLSVLFLGCHVAREPVLPSDISEWATDGTLPYLTAFLKIPAKRFFGPELNVIPLPEAEPRDLFRAETMSNGRRVELLAGYIANRIGLELPPVNFHAISVRFLRELGLEVDSLMGYLMRLYQWYIPEGIWLSARVRCFPSRAHVMAMVIVMLRLLYSIDGNAQSSLYWPSVSKRLGTAWSSSHRAKFQSVLETIEKQMLENSKKNEFDLKKYLKYCRDVVFPGLDIPPAQETMYNHLWSFFDKESQQDAPDKAEEEGENEDDSEAEQQSELEAEQDDSGSEQDESESEQDELESEKDGSDSSSSEEEAASQQQSGKQSAAGSAAWSRAPAPKSKPKEPTEEGEAAAEDDETREDQAEGEAAAATGPQRRDEEEEISSASDELSRIQHARSRLLKVMYIQLKSGNFKLIPGSAVDPPSPGEGSSCTMFPLQAHTHKHRKHVFGDYFILLFACSQVAGIRCNILHASVLQIDEDLRKLEQAALNSSHKES